MKSDPSGTSSSLERARELSHRLTGASPAAPARRPAFVSFRGQPAPPAAPVSAPVAPAPAPAVPAALPPLPEKLGEGGRRWEPLLGWARQASGASAAILMDPHGLLIASVGEIPLPDVEAIGARLS
ncbi:MAG: hypothetical protein L6R30_08150 [Thermoanaerobaculia bacterium]|nr:hypothetical protein [Thermoanaerobaculia bacterium]